ncbi:MAG: type II secretion system minor pseudopilin GspK [Halieaceae bacterium]|nr:type II secretion system minor pseudopilin GspK [Halieaceae bacterium]
MHYHRFRDRQAQNDRQRQGGAALIVAMLIFALAAALVVAMKSEFNRYYQRSANILSEAQVQAYLRAGEELAGMVLKTDYDQDKQDEIPRDDLTEIWNSDEVKQPMPLEGVGWIKGELQDLQGLFNLNLLAERIAREPGQPRKFTPQQQQFIRLLQALGEPALSQQEAIVIADAISDWLDEDQEPALNGAEDTYYSGLTPAYRPPNRSLTSVSELRAVANMTPEIYAALAPWVAALPESTTLNIHTAPPMVLRSINEDDNLNPLTEEEGEALRNSEYQDKKAFLESPVFANKKEKMEGASALLGESSDYFLLSATAKVADREMRLYSVLQRRDRVVGSISRANGSL